jgi:hypothetical protein
MQFLAEAQWPAGRVLGRPARRVPGPPVVRRAGPAGTGWAGPVARGYAAASVCSDTVHSRAAASESSA